MNVKKYIGLGLSAFTLVVLSGCSDNNDRLTTTNNTQTYELVLTNLTSNQPLSPLSVAVHGAAYSAWDVGSSSSIGLEMLAESGDGTTFLAESTAAGAYKTLSGSTVVLPGDSDTLILESVVHDDMTLTIASMLVNTNDAFAGMKGLDLSGMSLGDSVTLLLPVFDAGTEGNNELVGTIPGPADNGEGFNSTRDDVNVVSRHPGVVTNADGYTVSALDSSHRFDGPVAKLMLTRTL